jgi:hypothetical protein
MDEQDRLKFELDRLEAIGRDDLRDSGRVWLTVSAWSPSPAPEAAMTRQEDWIDWCSRLTSEMDTIIPGHGTGGLNHTPRRRLRRWVNGWENTDAGKSAYQYISVRRDGGFTVAVAADPIETEHVFQTKDVALLTCVVESCQRLLPTGAPYVARFYDVRWETSLPDRLAAGGDGRYGARVVPRHGFEVFEDQISGVSASDLAGDLVGHWGAPPSVVTHDFNPDLARSRPLRT